MKSTRALIGCLGVAVSVVLGACTQTTAPQPAEIAVAESETDICDLTPPIEDDSEEIGASGYVTFRRYLARGHTDKAIAMLKADPKWINYRGENNFTTLHCAAQAGSAETVQWLLDNGADVNATALDDFTPLHLARNPQVVALILQKRPDLTLRSLGRTPLEEAADKLVNPGLSDQRGDWLEIIRLLLDAGAEYDIITAIHLNDLPRVKAILKQSPELANRFGRTTPLRTAADLGHLEICQYLIDEHHVDVNDFEGGTGYPIIKSALPYPSIVRLLIENGADLKTRITWRGGRTGAWIVGDDATLLHHAAL